MGLPDRSRVPGEAGLGAQQFCEEKVEPLHWVFPHAVRSPDPAVKAYVRQLQQEVKDQGLWAIFLDEELGGPGFGQLKLGLLNEVIGRFPAAPQLFGAAAPTPATWRCWRPTAPRSRRRAG